MSELIRLVQAKQDENRYYVPVLSKFVNVEDSWTEQRYPQNPSSYNISYDISVALSQRVIVTQHDKEMLGMVKYQTRKSMAEAVFGEFRPMLNEITQLAFDVEDFETRYNILKAVDDILDRMFVDGIV